MFEALKPLLDNGILNEETREALETAWTSKLDEAREAVRTEIREEMAARYEHDKSVMVEALDRMTTEALTSQISKIAEERDALAEDRVRFTNTMMGKTKHFERHLEEALKAEISELRADRENFANAIKKLESFVAENLKKEISEFADDKADLACTKVAVVVEGKKKLQALQESFIKKASGLVESTVTNTLKKELLQLKEDIQEAKQNNFGRKIYEAFATEFSATHLNERAEVKRISNQLAAMEQKLSEAREAQAIAESKASERAAEIKRINESAARQNTLNELLKPLSRDKASVMKQLLESVPTHKLNDAFKKYLNPVMSGNAPTATKQTVVESHTEVTGDRTTQTKAESLNNVIEIRRLAGLTN